MNRPECPDDVLACFRTPPNRPSSSPTLRGRTDRTDVSLQDRCDLPMGQVDASGYTLTSAADTARRLFGDDAWASGCSVCGAPLRDATARRSGRCGRLDAEHRAARATAGGAL